MRRKEKLWCLWAAVAAVFDVVVPFGIVRSVGSLSGAFAFWLALTVIVVISGAVVTASWGMRGRR
ncbi:MAG: hypothetical protein CSA35_06530 [Dethiosulfovibrio peptidovorans]|nr:MAG: hypothetical protein CSA35_06530 [Dethiosulfovibrio peptidovorans]